MLNYFLQLSTAYFIQCFRASTGRPYPILYWEKSLLEFDDVMIRATSLKTIENFWEATNYHNN